MNARRRNGSLVMAALLAATMGPEAFNSIVGSPGPKREAPKEPNEDEKLFLNCLDRTGFRCWQARFAVGLTEEQRRYVNACISELKEDIASHGTPRESKL